MVVALSLAAALFYGAADFLGGLAARRCSTFAVVVWSQAIGLVILIPSLFFVRGIATPEDLGWGIACGVSGGLSLALLYRALALGTMSAISPIAAVIAAAIPVAFDLARGQRPSLIALVGISCAMVAVVLISTPGPTPHSALAIRSPHARRLPPGILEAAAAGIGFGLFLIALSQTKSHAGLWPLVGARATSLTMLAVAGVVARRAFSIVRPDRGIVVLAGALDMAANVLYVIASHIGALAVVAVLSSLYPASTTALAAAVLRERLATAQYLGLGIALTGVVCLSLA